MDGQHQLITVTDEGHLGLREAPQVLHAGVLLGNFKVEIGGIVGVFQILAVGVLIGLRHLVGVVDEAGKQGQVRGLLTDLLGEQVVLLGAVVLLLNDLPPAVDGLPIGEGGGVVEPHGLGGVQRIAIFQVFLVDVRADVLGEVRLQNVLIVPLVEHVAVDILGLEHVGGDVAGVVLDFGLGEHLVVVQIEYHQIKAGVGFLKTLLHLQHLGGGGVDVDGGVLRQGFFIKLVVGLFTPVVIVGAVIIFTGVKVIAKVQVAGGSFAAGLGIVGGLVGALAAAGGQTQHHGKREKQCRKLLHIHRDSFHILTAPQTRPSGGPIKTRLIPHV